MREKKTKTGFPIKTFENDRLVGYLRTARPKSFAGVGLATFDRCRLKGLRSRLYLALAGNVCSTCFEFCNFLCFNFLSFARSNSLFYISVGGSFHIVRNPVIIGIKVTIIAYSVILRPPIGSYYTISSTGTIRLGHTTALLSNTGSAVARSVEHVLNANFVQAFTQPTAC